MEYEPTQSQSEGMYSARFLKYMDEIFHWIWKLVANENHDVQSRVATRFSTKNLNLFFKNRKFTKYPNFGKKIKLVKNH